MTLKSKRHNRLLSATRPYSTKTATSLSSDKTRSVIRNYHVLRKELACAKLHGDSSKVESIQAQIDARGGLRGYQNASILGQSAQRGGDTSKILIQWLSELVPGSLEDIKGQRLRMLEVGALKPDNACSRSALLDVERIDLHSQHPSIKEQDFMMRPSPVADHECFDIVSLSLVVNFVSDPAGRGHMLRHVTKFLRSSRDESENDSPALFLVLPAPCVMNSRFLTEERLGSIMESLGYTLAKRKVSAKLVYYLWKYNGASGDDLKPLKKEELRSGKSRNNFAIVLR